MDDEAKGKAKEALGALMGDEAKDEAEDKSHYVKDKNARLRKGGRYGQHSHEDQTSSNEGR